VPRICTIDDCPEQTIARGWCEKHYRRWKKSGDPTKTSRIIGDDVARFFSHVDRRGPDECWAWQGSHNRPRRGTPYGAFRFQNRTRPAHVASYLIERGPGSIPEGFVLDHICSHTLCVNPAHLEPVTQAENVHRGKLTKISPQRLLELHNAHKAGASIAELARGEGVTRQAIKYRFDKLLTA